MNEKIRELKEQARDFYLLQEDLDCSIKELHELVDTKFAQLIAEECAMIAQSGTALAVSDVIKQTFGLKTDTTYIDIED